MGIRDCPITLSFLFCYGGLAHSFHSCEYKGDSGSVAILTVGEITV